MNRKGAVISKSFMADLGKEDNLVNIEINFSEQEPPGRAHLETETRRSSYGLVVRYERYNASVRYLLVFVAHDLL